MDGINAIEVSHLVDADATRALGRRLARRLLTQALEEPATALPPLLLLRGDLGAGKTCLVQGLAEGLGIEEPITSPTFALAHHYRGETRIQRSTNGAPRSAQASATDTWIHVPTALVHLDLYRLEQPAAAAELFAQEEEEARTLGAVLAVEWPERLAVLPQPCWQVELKEAGEGREARLLSPGMPTALRTSPQLQAGQAVDLG
jgi:tRNA threonylcarbamoyladenosine biosynthesis protein TsaE